MGFKLRSCVHGGVSPVRLTMPVSSVCLVEQFSKSESTNQQHQRRIHDLLDITTSQKGEVTALSEQKAHLEGLLKAVRVLH